MLQLARRGAVLAFGAAAFASAAGAARNDGTIGPGETHKVLTKSGYRVEIRISPNLGGHITSIFSLTLTRNGEPVAATASARFTMQAMPMPSLSLRLPSTAPGRYRGSGQTLTMPGRWQIDFRITPRGGRPLDIALLDLVIVE